MDRPTSMSLREYLVKVMSVRTKVASSTIEAIVSHQFESILGAMYTNNSVEISGLGKWLFNKKKATAKLEWAKIHLSKLQEELLLEENETKKGGVQKKIEEVESTIKYIANKI